MAGQVALTSLLKHHINSDQMYQCFIVRYPKSSMKMVKHTHCRTNEEEVVVVWIYHLIHLMMLQCTTSSTEVMWYQYDNRWMTKKMVDSMVR